MNRLLAVAVTLTVTFFCGCSTVETAESPAKAGRRPIEVLPAAQVAAASTAELMSRRTQLHQMILEIQRDVEMKAGLHMGVPIHDDRAKLNELYLEARQIDRELLRRWQGGDGAARVETVKAEF
jgi:hypothetical protein